MTPAAFLHALDRIRDGLEQVERAMFSQLESPEPLVAAIGDHILGAGGKRIRPALLFFAAELCGYTGPRRVQIAAAIELLHNATLLHDDVVDGAHLRRGREAANARWGNRRAVLVGDFLYARASAMVVEDGNLEILQVFASTIRRMAEGELLQLQESFDPELTEQRYYRVIERKSASLIGAACEAGAILGEVTRAERRRLADFGRELGLAFQLRDDALDYDTAEAQLGKPRYADLREGKVTLPLLLALKRANPAERAFVTRWLKEASELAAARGDGRVPDGQLEDGLERVAELVDRHHGVRDTLRRAEHHAALAADAVEPFGACAAREALLGAASFAVARAS